MTEKKVFLVVKDDYIKCNGEKDKGYDLTFIRDDTRENRRSFVDKEILYFGAKGGKTDKEKFINGESDALDCIDRWNCCWHFYVYTKDEMIKRYKDEYDKQVDKARDEYRLNVDKLKRQFAFEYLIDKKVKEEDNSDD